MNTNKNPIPIPLLFGEAYELGNYMGMLSVVESIKNKKMLSLKANGDVFNPIEIDVECIQDFSIQFERMYGINFIELKEIFARLRPLGETISIEDQLFRFNSDLHEFGKTIVHRSVKSRSNFVKVSQSEIEILIKELTNEINGVNFVLEIISGFFDGQSFVEWCELQFHDDFNILIEMNLYDEQNPENHAKKPDLMVVQNKKVVLIGDIKSYFPFIRQNRTNRLKDALNQIPVEGLNSEMLKDSSFVPEALYLNDFVKRYNLLTRYFKMMMYVEIIYQNSDELFQQNPLFSIVVLPGKSVLFHFQNYSDFEEKREILLKTIPFKIKDPNSCDYDIKEKILNEHQVDLEYDLLTGDRYIEPNNEKGQYLIRERYYDRPEDLTIPLGKIPVFSAAEEIKTAIEPPIAKGWKGTPVLNIQTLHLKKIIKKLTQENSKFHCIIDGSDQGTGKNFSFAKYIKYLDNEDIEQSILMVCPRKDTLNETIISICNNLGIEAPHLDDYGNIQDSEFNQGKVKIRLIRSEFGQQIVFNQRGWINQKFTYGGEGATSKLNNLIKTPKSGIEITFLTAQTLPFYFRSHKQQKLPLQHYKKFYQRFDLIVFDELTNSPPLVREVLIDLINGYKQIQTRIPNIIPKMLVLDASITSPDLFIQQFKPLISADSKFSTFSEYIQSYEENPIEDVFEEVFIKLDYFRYQLNQSLIYGYSSIGWQDDYVSMPFEEIKNQIQEQITIIQKKYWPNFPDFDTLLQHGEVMFFIDNKSLIEEFNDWIIELGYDCGISIAEQKERAFYDSKNIIGTNSLAFGTNFPSKKLMIIIPPYQGTDYFKYRQNIELLRQVTKRMRGSDENVDRMVSFLVFPTKENNIDLSQSVSINFYRIRNSIREFLYQKKYHQLPSFSSYLNNIPSINPNYDTKLRNSSIYTPKVPSFGMKDKNQISLEFFLGTIFPKLRVIFLKWGFRCRTSFKIGFNNDKYIGLPLSNFICYTLDNQDFSRTFQIEVYASKALSDLSKLKKYLAKNTAEVRNDLAFVYRMMQWHNQHEKQPSKAAYNIIDREIKNIEQSETDGKKCLILFAHFIQNLFNVNSLPLSGTAYLLTLNIAEKTSNTFGNNLNIYQQISYQNKEYVSQLFKMTSPLKSLYFGAGNYFEQPVLVNIEKKGLTTVGYLCHYPNFAHFDFSQPNYQLLKYCLLKELYRENYVYLPNLLKGSTL